MSAHRYVLLAISAPNYPSTPIAVVRSTKVNGFACFAFICILHLYGACFLHFALAAGALHLGFSGPISHPAHRPARPRTSVSFFRGPFTHSSLLFLRLYSATLHSIRVACACFGVSLHGATNHVINLFFLTLRVCLGHHATFPLPSKPTVIPSTNILSTWERLATCRARESTRTTNLASSASSRAS